MKKSIFIILFFTIISSLYATSSDYGAYKRLVVVGIHTMLKGTQAPDAFFEGSAFESIKPTKILNGKSRYNLTLDMRKLPSQQLIKKIGSNNARSRADVYNISKKGKYYSFFFFGRFTPKAYDECFYKGRVSLVEGDKREEFARNIAKKNKLQPIKSLIKIDESFTKTEFEEIPKEIINENKGLIEMICLVDDSYICVTLKKVYSK